MRSGQTVGVIGTLVWDRIFGLGVGEGPTEAWGGITYALSAMSAALGPGWRILAIAKVGADLSADALRLVRGIPGVDISGLREVPEPNNRVEIRYRSDRQRTERLTGGVPPWSLDELRPLVGPCDALYVNFISGSEMNLATAADLRRDYAGPIYADLHSLFLGHSADGVRVPRRLDEWPSWSACFNTIQMNEHEFELLTDGDPAERVWRQLGGGTDLVLVTLGDQGARYFSAGIGAYEQGTVPSPGGPRRGDPTGCGDVWGATMFAQRLQGQDIVTAMLEANRVAGASVDYTGAEGLHGHLGAASFLEERA